MKAEAEESLREIKISEWVESETLTEYSPAGSVVLPAAKSKGMFTITASCACATRVVAMAVRTITPAITKALVFMGHSFFSLLASKPFCHLLGSLHCSALHHAAHFRAFLWEAQCTESELRGDFG